MRGSQRIGSRHSDHRLEKEGLKGPASSSKGKRGGHERTVSRRREGRGRGWEDVLLKQQGNTRARDGDESVEHCMLTVEEKNGNMDVTHPNTRSVTGRDKHQKNEQGTIRTVLSVVGHLKKGSAQVVQ